MNGRIRVNARRATSLVVVLGLVMTLIPMPALAEMVDNVSTTPADGAAAAPAPLAGDDPIAPAGNDSTAVGSEAPALDAATLEEGSSSHHLADQWIADEAELTRSFADHVIEEVAEGGRQEDLVRAAWRLYLSLAMPEETTATDEDARSESVPTGVSSRQRDLILADSKGTAGFIQAVLKELGVASNAVRQDNGANVWLLVRLGDDWFHVDAWAAAHGRPEEADSWLCASDERVRELDPSRTAWTLFDGGEAPVASRTYEWDTAGSASHDEDTQKQTDAPEGADDEPSGPADAAREENNTPAANDADDAPAVTEDDKRNESLDGADVKDDATVQDSTDSSVSNAASEVSPNETDQPTQEKENAASRDRNEDDSAHHAAPTKPSDPLVDAPVTEDPDDAVVSTSDAAPQASTRERKNPILSNPASLLPQGTQTTASKGNDSEGGTNLLTTLSAASSGVTSYEYQATPMMKPFNYMIYVKTQNPDPTSFRLVDRDSRFLAGTENAAVFELLNRTFLDVSYENPATYRVPGGYLFIDRSEVNDGGQLILQARAEDGSYVDTNVRVGCDALKNPTTFLLEDCTQGAQSFFDKLDLIQYTLHNVSIYPFSIFDVSRPTDTPYPLLASSPYPELSLNEHYDCMFERCDEGLLAKLLFPFVLDSASFPSLMISMAKRIDENCTYTWGDTHEMVYIQLDGQEGYYGGAGNGGRDPVFSDEILPAYVFDGSSSDAVGESLSDASTHLRATKALGTTRVEAYRDQIRGKTFANAIGRGSWIRVLREGSGGYREFAYVIGGFQEGETRIMSDVWVDGRYINTRERYVPGTTFDDRPNCDIVVRDLTYTDSRGQQHTDDVLFMYEDSTNTWKAYIHYAHYSLFTWVSGDISDELTLTEDHVRAMQVDRNTNVPIPSALIYDGTAEPGTPFDTKPVESVRVPATMELQVGGSQALPVEVIPHDADFRYYKIESSDTSVVAVERGYLRGVNPGEATVTVRMFDGSASASCEVRVYKAIQKATLPEVTIQIGESKKLSLTVEPDDASHTAIDWQSSNENIVTVDKDGTIRGVGMGYANVTCVAANGMTVYGYVNVVCPIDRATVSPIPDQDYWGWACTPQPTVRMNGVELWEGYDYVLTYKNNAAPGTASVTIEGMGSYVGKKTVTFRILPSFSDVFPGAWYYDVVRQAAALGLFSGYDDGRFGPNDGVTRGQVATVLWRMAGSPSGTRGFSDVRDASKYYYRAVRWAGSAGVVNGYDDGRFGPDEPVTREQLAAMLANYASRVGGIRVEGTAADYATMSDRGSVSPWAQKSLGWCFRNQILSGKSGRIDPKGMTTRAEAAKMMLGLRSLLS